MKLEVCHLESSVADSLPAEPAGFSGDTCRDWQPPGPRRSAGGLAQGLPAQGSPGIERAILMIRHDYPRPLTVSSLARACGMSVRTLHRCYRAATGKTIGKDLTARRIQVAAEMLQTEGLKLEPIALETGLGSAKNLCRLFKEHFGVTPGQWRESWQREQALHA